MHWTGHTGCVILAPHLVGMKKKDLGPAALRARPPSASAATACAGAIEDELYNDGSAFKITCRDQRGVMVTIIADNYYGYCKKEVKTQISFAANLFGLCEEEHAGGAHRLRHLRARPGFLRRPHRQPEEGHLRRRDEPAGRSGRAASPKATPSTGAIPNVYYVPEDAVFQRRAKASSRGSTATAMRQLTLRADATYVLPSGFRVRLEKQTRRHRVAAGRRAAARNAVPQAVHRFGRRQIGDLEVDRQRAAEGPGLRQRLPPRYGAGGGDPQAGISPAIYRNRAAGRAHRAARSSARSARWAR